MKFRRINDNTLSCIISPEDLRANGFKIDDFFERKKEAVDFIRSTVAQAAIAENFDLEGELTTMRVSVLPDHSLSLLITRETSREGASREMRKIAESIFASIASKMKEKEEASEEDPSDSLMKALLSDVSGARQAEGNTPKEHRNDSGKPGAFMFSFYSVRDAMDCCRLFSNAGQLASSFYYLAEDETYFLILRRAENTPAGFEKWVLSGNEFGELVTSNEQYISFVKEHGVCIAAEHAVEMFMDVMPGIKVPKVRRHRAVHRTVGRTPGPERVEHSASSAGTSGPNEAGTGEQG